MATASQVFRDFNADGVPASGAHKVEKSAVRQLLVQYESVISAFISNGGLIYTSKAAMDADLAHETNSSAWVIGDATVANNGIYQKLVGPWIRVADLPYSFIIASDVGAGTANAIQATTSIPVSSSALVVLNIAETNTASPVTVSFNGGPALTIQTNSGNNVMIDGLLTGMLVFGFVSGSTFRLVSDQVSTAIVAAAEAAAEAAIAAAEAAALRDPVSFDLVGNGTTGPYDVGETIEADSAIVVFLSGVAQIIGTDFTYSGSNVTFTSLVPTASDRVHGFVFASRGIPVPAPGAVGVNQLTVEVKGHIPSLSENAALVVESAQQLKLNYHKARGAWHVKAFGTSLTDVGAENVSVDTAALQSAMSSGEAIDITGTNLYINNTISVLNQSAKIGASIDSRQPGGSSSVIYAEDDTVPIIFQVGNDNFEASNFSVRGQGDNELTTAFWFERTVDTYRDIDARLINVQMSVLGRGTYHKGRGLEASGCLYSDLHIAGNELDQPATWTPRGSASIDGIDTGTRGYRFNNNRAHAMQAPFVKNTGTYAVNIGGIEVNGLIADVGADGGLFTGVAIDAMWTGIQCRYSGFASSRLVDLSPGSRDSFFVNFNCAGYMGVSGNRISNHGIRMTSSVALPIRDIFFIGGKIGPTREAAVNFLGNGTYGGINFTNIIFTGIGQDGSYSPIQIADTVPSLNMKLLGCVGRDNAASMPFLTALNTPANNTMYREVTSTIDGTFSAWATTGVLQPTTA
jgi:hypothetical protein